MKTKAGVRILSLLLSVAMITTLFSGCGDKNEEEAVEGTATEVAFNAEGKYTTTVETEKVKLSGISADKVSVVYNTFDSEGYSKALEEAGENGTVDKDSYYVEEKTEVTDVAENGEKSLTVSFSDENAKTNVPENYVVKIDSKKLAIPVDVNLPEYQLTPNVDAVSAYDKEIRLTLTLDETEFEKEVSAEDIELYGSFSTLKIASLSSAGKNLTMQLTGELVEDENSNTFLSGFVGIDRAAVVNAAKTSTVSIPVTTRSASFVRESLTASGGTVGVLMNLYDTGLVDTLTPNSVVFEKGVTVTGLAKVNDTQAALTLKVNGAADKNSAAALLNGQTVKVGDYTFIAEFPPVSFYPVFDYVEQDGDNLKFTLMLYASSGAFAPALEAGQISLGGDFEGGSVVSVSKSSDSVAELILSVPADGQTTETLNKNGAVTLAQNALVNSWGDFSARAITSDRNFSQESMGRNPAGALTDVDIAALKEIVGGFGNTTIGTITSLGSGIASAGSAIVTVLELTGVIESEKVKLDKIYSAIQEMSSHVANIEKLLENESIKNTVDRVRGFYKDLDDLRGACERYATVLKGAMRVLKDEKHLSEPNGSPEENAEQWDAYLKQLLPLATERDKTNALIDIQHGFDNVKGYLNQHQYTDTILKTYDDYMERIHNFDTAANWDKENFRLEIQTQLLQAATMLGVFYSYTDASETYDLVMKNYTDVEATFVNNKVNRRTDGKVYCYTFGRTFKQEMIASNRMTNKNGHHCAVAEGDIKYFTDTAQGDLYYQPRPAETIYESKDQFKVVTETAAMQGESLKIEWKTHFSDGRENIYILGYSFKGLADSFSGSGVDFSDAQAQEFCEKMQLRGMKLLCKDHVYGYKYSYNNTGIGELDLAGFIYPTNLRFKNCYGNQNGLAGIPYYAWRYKHYSTNWYRANLLTGEEKVKKCGGDGFAYTGVSGENINQYLLNWVLA